MPIRIFTKNKEAIEVKITEHALKRLEERELKSRVLPILELISSDIRFFMRHAQRDQTLATPKEDGYEPYIVGFNGLKLSFLFNKEKKDLILLSAMNNLESD